MICLKTLIGNAEKKHERASGNAQATINLALRCFQAYGFSDLPEARQFLQKANFTAISAYRRNTAHIQLFTLSIYIATCAGHYDSANEMLDKAFSSKSFLKTNEPFYYGILCFLYANLEIRQKRIRSAKKHWRALSQHMKSVSDRTPYIIMQGLLNLELGEYQDAFNFFNEAFSLGSKSVFLYEGMYRALREADAGSTGPAILLVLIYAARRGSDVHKIAEKFQENLFLACEARPELAEKLYEASSYSPVLYVVCKKLISLGDVSEKAYRFYKEAESKQVFVPDLGKWLILSSYETGAKKINRYPLAQFLAKANGMDSFLAIYVYHHILTDSRLAELLPEASSKILGLGAVCIDKNIQTRMAMTIYHYFWKRCQQLGITGIDVNKAEEILRENLTLFELRAAKNSQLTGVYVTEPEIRGMTFAPMTDGVLLTSAIGKNTKYASIDATKRIVLDEKLECAPMVETADIELYQYFFEKGDRRLHLLCFIANYFLSLDEIPDAATYVFEALVPNKNITKAYKNRILAALGKLHYNAFSFSEALQCYSQIDYETLEDEFVPKILEIYLKTREYERAANLLAKKHDFVTPEELFCSVMTILDKQRDGKKVTDLCYKLLVMGFYSDEIFQEVLTNFEGALMEWTELAKVFDEDNRYSPKLDELIVEKALMMSAFDIQVQRAFVRLGGKKRTPLLEKFVELAVYKMLKEEVRPEYDVLVILEKKCLEEGERFLLLAVAATYVKYGITTLKSDGIIANALEVMEETGELLPVFKELAGIKNPFVQKHEPLVHVAAPGKDCFVYYRTDEEEQFLVKKMDYMRYGMYIAQIPLFFGETLQFYFSEETKSGSVTTAMREAKNKKPFLYEDSHDEYFTINNALIYEQMFKHEKVEEIIGKLVKEVQPVMAGLL